MHRIILAATFAAILVVAACGSAATPSPSPSPPTSPAPVPSEPAPATPVPSDPTPSEAPSEAPSTPAPPTAEERYLLDGVLRGATDCEPVREALPAGASAGIECAADDPAVARVGFYLFEDEATLLDAYFGRMAEEGVVLESGGCSDGEGEGSYIPYEGTSPWRDGCFVNDEGFANYRATLPGAHVYIGVLGRSDDMAALASFAWLGNQDTPGNPTLWGQPAK